MKKNVNLIFVILLIMVLFTSCDDASQNHGHLDVKDVDLSAYSSFISFSEESGARGVSIYGDIYGYVRDVGNIEKIVVKNSAGEDYLVTGVESIGNRCARVHFSSSFESMDLFVNLETGDAFDIGSWVSSFDTDKIQHVLLGPFYEIDNEVYFRFQAGFFKVNLEDGTVTELINKGYVTAYSDDWFLTDDHVIWFKSGNGNMSYVLFSEQNPIIVDSGLRWDWFGLNTSGEYMLNKNAKCILHLPSKTEYRIVDGKLATIQYDAGGVISGRVITQFKSNNGSRYEMNTKYDAKSGYNLQYIRNTDEIVEIKESNGEVLVSRYPVSDSLRFDDTDYMAYHGDYVFMEKLNQGLFALNYKTGDLIQICQGVLAAWDTAAEGVFYSVYKTASSIETYYYDLHAKSSVLYSATKKQVDKVVWMNY